MTNIHYVCPHCEAINRFDKQRLNQQPKCGKCHQLLLTGEPVELNNNNFDKFISRNDLPVVVDFWASWCQPCQMMAPHFAKAAQLLCARGTKAVEGGLIWSTDKRLRLNSPTRFYEQQVCAYLAAITAPSLLIMAEKTLPFFNVEDYQRRVAAHPNLQLVKLAGGHHLHIDDNVEQVISTVKAFLAGATTDD